MGTNVEIKITEMPRTEIDLLEEELFWINMYLDDDGPKDSYKVITLTKRKKEIKERFKLIELEEDF